MSKPEFHKIPGSVDEVLNFISRAEVGRRYLALFIAPYIRGEIEVRELDEKALSQIRQNHALGGTPAAGFIQDRDRRTIFVRRKTEIGLLAPLLFHEIVHSVDEEYLRSYPEWEQRWRELKKKTSDLLQSSSQQTGKAPFELTRADVCPERLHEVLEARKKCVEFDQLRLFRTEKLAYEALYALTQELIQKIPGYRNYLDEWTCRGYIFDRAVTETDIVQGYSLDTVRISA